ncbi:MAG: hypothetical protein WCE68_10400 [Anaerolineales bacterium]
MSTAFIIQSSDPLRLEKASRVAREFAQPYAREETVGIVFLGAIARGYYDASADIDIAFFIKPGAAFPLKKNFLQVEGLDVHCHFEEIESGIQTPWDMAKCWTYSQRQIYYDPEGRIARFLEEKVPLQPEEKKWLLMSGLVLSEWYFNRLARLWVERGNMVSAQHMFYQGLNYFFEMLFALNDELVADMKWRYYCVEKLPRLPQHFQERIREIMSLHAFTLEELERRQSAFMEMWQEMVPLVEQEAQMSYDEIKELV